MNDMGWPSKNVEGVQLDLNRLAQGVELLRASRHAIRNIVLEGVRYRIPVTKLFIIRADPSTLVDCIITSILGGLILGLFVLRIQLVLGWSRLRGYRWGRVDTRTLWWFGRSHDEERKGWEGVILVEYLPKMWIWMEGKMKSRMERN